MADHHARRLQATVEAPDRVRVIQPEAEVRPRREVVGRSRRQRQIHPARVTQEQRPVVLEHMPAKTEVALVERGRRVDRCHVQVEVVELHCGEVTRLSGGVESRANPGEAAEQ